MVYHWHCHCARYSHIRQREVTLAATNSWVDFAKELEGNVQAEIRADTPSLLHQITNVATGGATVGIPGPGNTSILTPWQRWRFPIMLILGLAAVWYFLIRK